MALRTLKDVTEIDGFPVCELDKTAPTKPKEFVIVNHEANSISFTIQNGPIAESGVNGCQVDTLLMAAQIMIHGLNEILPCEENALCLISLCDAIGWLDKRKADREQRGVEGKSEA